MQKQLAILVLLLLVVGCGESEQADAELNKAIRLKPDYAQAYNNRYNQVQVQK